MDWAVRPHLERAPRTLATWEAESQKYLLKPERWLVVHMEYQYFGMLVGCDALACSLAALAHFDESKRPTPPPGGQETTRRSGSE